MYRCLSTHPSRSRNVIEDRLNMETPREASQRVREGTQVFRVQCSHNLKEEEKDSCLSLGHEMKYKPQFAWHIPISMTITVMLLISFYSTKKKEDFQ